MGILVKRPVRVKVVVTEGFKVRRTGEIRTALARLDVVGKQLTARIESAHDKPESPVGARLGAEQQRNEQAHAALKRELEKVSGLETGSVYDWGALEGTVEVEVGDDFSRLGACEVVVKDDRIIEIRDRLCPEVSETSS
jgi:hypothetical protein